MCASVFDCAVNDSHGAAEDITDVLKDINDRHGSLQLSVTQSQSVDGTEPATRPATAGG